jgi:hypothetical protein
VSRSLARSVDGSIEFQLAGSGTTPGLPGTSAFLIAGELRPERASAASGALWKTEQNSQTSAMRGGFNWSSQHFIFD